MEIKIRNLRADEIECRVDTIPEKGARILLHKNARVDQTILDEVFGIMGWQRHHCEIKGEIYCTVSIWDEEKSVWVQKQDVGTGSVYQKVKGEASDSFKRAGVNVGIGRELYTAPFIFIPSAQILHIDKKDGKWSIRDTYSVSHIYTTEDKVIKELEIVNQVGQPVFTYGRPHLGMKEKEMLALELARTGVSEEELLKRYSLRSIEDMNRETYLRAVTALRKTKPAA